MVELEIDSQHLNRSGEFGHPKNISGKTSKTSSWVRLEIFKQTIANMAIRFVESADLFWPLKPNFF